MIVKKVINGHVLGYDTVKKSYMELPGDFEEKYIPEEPMEERFEDSPDNIYESGKRRKRADG